MRVLNTKVSVTQGLIDKLKELYPDRLPAKDTDLEELRYLQGQQSVIHKLQELFDDAYEEN